MANATNRYNQSISAVPRCAYHVAEKEDVHETSLLPQATTAKNAQTIIPAEIIRLRRYSTAGSNVYAIAFNIRRVESDTLFQLYGLECVKK